MNICVGRTGQVIDIGPCGVAVRFAEPVKDWWRFPYFVLEKAEAPCPFKPGDIVRLTRKWTREELGVTWFPEFEKYIGQAAEVIKEGQPRNVLVSFKDGNISWHMPWIVFEKVEKPVHEFRPFEKVLVRNGDSDAWRATFFSHEDNVEGLKRYVCVAYTWRQCVPYEGNEHLLGTTNRPEE